MKEELTECCGAYDSESGCCPFPLNKQLELAESMKRNTTTPIGVETAEWEITHCVWCVCR